MSDTDPATVPDQPTADAPDPAAAPPVDVPAPDQAPTPDDTAAPDPVVDEPTVEPALEPASEPADDGPTVPDAPDPDPVVEPVLDAPAETPAPAPVTDPDADLRAQVDTTTSTLAPGQTVVTDGLGNVRVTGVPAPEHVEPTVTVFADPGDGDTNVALETPLGRILVTFEADGEGNAWVFVKGQSGAGGVDVINAEVEVFRFRRA